MLKGGAEDIGLTAFRRRYPKAQSLLIGETGVPLSESFGPAVEWFTHLPADLPCQPWTARRSCSTLAASALDALAALSVFTGSAFFAAS